LAPKKSWLQMRAEYALAVVLVQALRWLPFRAAKMVALGTARFLDLALPKLRKTGLKNLSFAFPELAPLQRNQIIDGVFRGIARLLLTFARFPSLNASNISEWIAYEGFENYRDAQRAGRGVLIATAHLGNWELSAFAHALMTEPMNVMVRPLDNPLIDALVEQRRALSGNRLIFKHEAARAVIKALRSNQAVGILIDQNTSPAEGVFVNFFGKYACAGSAFVKFAYHANAIVIPGFALWDERKRQYVLRFYPAVELTGDAQRDTERLHSILEQIIREHPDQWMWIHRRWKTRPNGEAAFY
jgi:KDO2-lipid IV(A) lauroyltransferase